MATYWSVTDATDALRDSLSRLGTLDEQKLSYEYSYPPQLLDDIRAEATRVRDAVRFLCSPEADD